MVRITMKTKYIFIAALAAVAMLNTSCEKVSPQGVLMAGSAVEDRVKMSELFYKDYLRESSNNIIVNPFETGVHGYSFLVGGDSHVTTDPGRMDEMFALGLENDDLLYCHLGDIADTKPEYYITLDKSIQHAKSNYVHKYYKPNELGRYVRKDDPYDDYGLLYEDIKFPFFPVVGNHDLTHNGWALWSNLFHSSFYEFDVICGYDSNNEEIRDHFIFLDTASGTLGKRQVELIEEGILDGEDSYRYTFIFGHTNIFLPQYMQFASTFPREEAYFLLKQFDEWNATIVFCGHVHKWDEQVFNDVYFITLDSMSERNSPKPGDYLVRVTVDKDGTIEIENVHMNYVAKK